MMDLIGYVAMRVWNRVKAIPVRKVGDVCDDGGFSFVCG